MKALLQFMQNEDKNGTWMEWAKEIENGESQFDKGYIMGVLSDWYNESKDEKYLIRLNQLKTI